MVGLSLRASTSSRVSTKYGPFMTAIPSTYWPRRAESVFWPTFTPCFICSMMASSPPSWADGYTSMVRPPLVRSSTASAQSRKPAWKGSVSESTWLNRRLYVSVGGASSLVPPSAGSSTAPLSGVLPEQPTRAVTRVSEVIDSTKRNLRRRMIVPFLRLARVTSVALRCAPRPPRIGGLPWLRLLPDAVLPRDLDTSEACGTSRHGAPGWFLAVPSAPYRVPRSPTSPCRLHAATGRNVHTSTLIGAVSYTHLTLPTKRIV